MKTNFYAQYLKEREGLDVLETETGFATYKIKGNICYIQDIYVTPDCRNAGVASSIADQITLLAKGQGCTILTGSVDANANGAQASDKVLTAYGMKPYNTIGTVTYYFKEIP